MKRLLLLCAPLLLAAPLAAQQEPTDSTRVHVVRPGDTLWDLSRQYLRDPYLWPEIFSVNRDRVRNPHWIYPAEQIRIPGVSAPGDATRVAGVLGASETTVLGVSEAAVPQRTVFFPHDGGPAGPRVLDPLDPDRRPAVAPGDFFRAGILVPDAEVTPLGELVEVLSPSVLPVPLDPRAGLFERVFVRVAPGGAGQVQVGGRLHFWRPGRLVAPYGRIYESTGLGRVVELNGEIATVEVVQLFDAVRVGDLALPVRDFQPVAGVRPQPAGGLEGRILAFQRPHALHAVHELAFVDLGDASGVREGDEFLVVLPPERRSWGVRPEVPVARVQVVRVTGRTSAVQVVHLEQPALTEGLPVRLVGKMP